MKNIKIIFVCAISIFLSACNAGLFDKDNTPTPASLVSFTPEIRIKNLWTTSARFGVGSDYLKIRPAVTETAIFIATKDGRVTAIEKSTGRIIWNVYTHLTVSGGLTAHDGLIFLGTRESEVTALYQSNGKIAWQNTMNSEILAPPAVGYGKVVAKTIDGQVSAFSIDDGHKLWSYQQNEPNLMLRGSSAPAISGDSVVAGFANGNLVKLSLQNGHPLWQRTIAVPEGTFAIQRMIDIDADPLIHNNRIYVATYQGRISSLHLASGTPIWTENLSSYTGLTADNENVYVTDAKSHVWALNAARGSVKWHQHQLEARDITAPALMDNYIVVGDEKGYLHWLNKEDGHFAARVRIAGFGVLTTPVVDNHILYALTRDGHLAAYALE